jgi:hypothetical protein
MKTREPVLTPGRANCMLATSAMTSTTASRFEDVAKNEAKRVRMFMRHLSC